MKNKIVAFRKKETKDPTLVMAELIGYSKVVYGPQWVIDTLLASLEPIEKERVIREVIG